MITAPRECVYCGSELSPSLVCVECVQAGGEKDTIHLQAHPGPPTEYLRSHARLNIIGGARGGSKTRTSLYRPLSFRPRLRDPRKPKADPGYIIPAFDDPRFVGMIFRREAERLRKKGGIWDECKEVYCPLGAKANNNSMTITFKSGAKIQCAGIEHEKDVEKYRGLAFTWILLEEGPEFTSYIVAALRRCSRPIARSKTAPWIDVTCNPDPDSWVYEYVKKFLDADGYPIAEECRKTYWAIPQAGEEIAWVDELDDYDGDPADYTIMSGDIETPALSVRFIPSRVEDNPTIVELDPSYIGELELQEDYLRDRERFGCWHANPNRNMFERSRFHYIEAQDVPAVVWTRAIRYWDLASTPKEAHSQPDASAGALTATLMCPECAGWRFYDDGEPCELCNSYYDVKLEEKLPIIDALHVPDEEERLEPTFWILGARVVQLDPDGVQHIVRRTAAEDGISVPVYIEEESGASGKFTTAVFESRILPEYEVHGDRPGARGKESRSGSVAGAAARGTVFVVIGPYVGLFRKAMRMFPKKGKHGERDLMDAIAGGYNVGLVHEWFEDAGEWVAAVSPRRGS